MLDVTSRCADGGMGYPGSGYYSVVGVLRRDAIPAGGGPAGSDPALIRSQLLDAYGIDYAILVGGGTVGVMILLSIAAGTSLGIEGFNGLELIGLAPLTGFISAGVSTRELAPLIAALALAAQVGCRFTAQLGSMRLQEEIDALAVMAVQPMRYLVTTRVLAAMIAIIPLYLIGLIGSYIAAEATVAGVPTELEVLGTPRAIRAEVDESLFRAAQEGLTNVRKHAYATTTTVVLDYRDDDHVRLEVRDDGRGLPEELDAGFGLTGLRERMANLGGRMSLDPAGATGLTLTVEVPG